MPSATLRPVGSHPWSDRIGAPAGVAVFEANPAWDAGITGGWALNISVAFQYYFGQCLVVAQLAQSRKEEKILSQEACAVAKMPTAAGINLQDSGNRSSGDMLMNFIVQSLHDDNAEEVISINLHGKSEMADYMIVASGRSTRQVTSISEKLVEKLKHDLKLATRVEGKEHGDWVLIDAGDVIVHVFRPEVRQFYQLEKMWMSSDGESAPF